MRIQSFTERDTMPIPVIQTSFADEDGAQSCVSACRENDLLGQRVICTRKEGSGKGRAK